MPYPDYGQQDFRLYPQKKPIGFRAAINRSNPHAIDSCRPWVRILAPGLEALDYLQHVLKGEGRYLGLGWIQQAPGIPSPVWPSKDALFNYAIQQLLLEYLSPEQVFGYQPPSWFTPDPSDGQLHTAPEFYHEML